MANYWLTIALLLNVTAAGTFADEPAKVLFAESFGEKLDSDWTWVRENCMAWRLEKNALIVRPQPGYLHANYNNSQNILLRPVPDTKSFAVEVCLESEPQAQYEHAGLVLYYDDDNYVALFREFLNGTRKLQMVAEKAGKPQFAVKPSDAKPVWLRLEIADEKLTARFRELEKHEWTTVGIMALPSNGKAKVGIMSGGTPKDAVRSVSFKDLRVLQLPK